jgi:hypothetical protein
MAHIARTISAKVVTQNIQTNAGGWIKEGIGQGRALAKKRIVSFSL